MGNKLRKKVKKRQGNGKTKEKGKKGKKGKKRRERSAYGLSNH